MSESEGKKRNKVLFTPNWKIQCLYHWVVHYPGSIRGSILLICVEPHPGNRKGQG